MDLIKWSCTSSHEENRSERASSEQLSVRFHQFKSRVCVLQNLLYNIFHINVPKFCVLASVSRHVYTVCVTQLNWVRPPGSQSQLKMWKILLEEKCFDSLLGKSPVPDLAELRVIQVQTGWVTQWAHSEWSAERSHFHFHYPFFVKCWLGKVPECTRSLQTLMDDDMSHGIKWNGNECIILTLNCDWHSHA